PFASRHGDQAGRVEGRGHAQAVRYRAFRQDDAVPLTTRVIDGPDLRPEDRWILRRPQIPDRPAREAAAAHGVEPFALIRVETIDVVEQDSARLEAPTDRRIRGQGGDADAPKAPG